MQTFLSLRQQNPNLPIAQISRAVGVTSSYASWYLRRVGLASSYHAERDAKIIEAWQAGDTYAVIQEKFRLCYQRVRQIIAGYLGSGEMPKASTRRKETHDD
jgi:Mor family transcriptional regulator